MQKENNETTAYQALMNDVISDVIPKFYREVEYNGDCILTFNCGVNLEFLPPANVVCEGYVFTGVCLSTGGSPLGGFSIQGVLHRGFSIWGVLHPRGFSIRGVLHPEGVLHLGGFSIQSMCGRYASYWNAFLLQVYA